MAASGRRRGTPMSGRVSTKPRIWCGRTSSNTPRISAAPATSRGNWPVFCPTGRSSSSMAGRRPTSACGGCISTASCSTSTRYLNPAVFGTVVRPCLADYHGFALVSGTSNGDDHFNHLRLRTEADPRWDQFIIPSQLDRRGGVIERRGDRARPGHDAGGILEGARMFVRCAGRGGLLRRGAQQAWPPRGGSAPFPRTFPSRSSPPGTWGSTTTAASGSIRLRGGRSISSTTSRTTGKGWTTTPGSFATGPISQAIYIKRIACPMTSRRGRFRLGNREGLFWRTNLTSR